MCFAFLICGRSLSAAVPRASPLRYLPFWAVLYLSFPLSLSVCLPSSPSLRPSPSFAIYCCIYPIFLFLSLFLLFCLLHFCISPRLPPFHITCFPFSALFSTPSHSPIHVNIFSQLPYFSSPILFSIFSFMPSTSPTSFTLKLPFPSHNLSVSLRTYPSLPFPSSLFHLLLALFVCFDNSLLTSYFMAVGCLYELFIFFNIISGMLKEKPSHAGEMV